MNELPVELADLVEPVPVTAAGSNAVLMVVIAVAVVISVLAATRWWKKNKHRRRTLRRLRCLRRDFTEGRLTSRTLAYALASELRGCLRCHCLCATQPQWVCAGSEHDRWQRFVARLDLLRYQPGSALDPQQVGALLREAADWARRSR